MKKFDVYVTASICFRMDAINAETKEEAERKVLEGLESTGLPDWVEEEPSHFEIEFTEESEE